MNFVRGRVRRTDDGGGCVFDGSALSLALGELDADLHNEVVLGVRPQSLAIAAPGDGAAWRGTVFLVEALGSEQIVHLSAGDLRDLVVVALAEMQLSIGEDVGIRVPASAVHLFDAQTGRRMNSPIV